jgi:hypothetical protein
MKAAMIPKRTTTIIFLALLAGLCTCVLAQDDFAGKKSPSVTMTPAPLATVLRGTETPVTLHFHINSGFHINSNKPTEEYLIPTELKLDVPTDIVVGKIGYPEGESMSFSFAPDEKLSVYSGAFDVAVGVRPLSTVVPGKYEFRGRLRYQACDKASCYPPKTLPVSFEIKVVKAAVVKKNPAQSPHIHN